jgi:aryl-alcohol dehydrogenase-like predicted oxidoreductase
MTMRYKLLGRSGLRVSEMALGTMTFGTEWGWGADNAESRKQFELYAASGGNFLDTADIYTNGTSERILGELVGPEREHFVIATKYSFSTGADVNASGNHRKNLVHSLEGSLRRLGTDYVDLYWVHAWDAITPVEETMRALDDMVRAGKVLHVGISDAPAWWIARANTVAESHGWTPFTAVQLRYSLLDRTPQRELLPMANALDLGVTPWNPLGAGVLTGKYNTDHARYRPAEPRRKETPGYAFGQTVPKRDLHIAATVVQIADEISFSPAQVALAWLRQRPGTQVPIVGARTHQQLADNLGYLNLTLDPTQTTVLDNVTTVDLGFPHDMLQETGAGLRGGEYSDRLDVPNNRLNHS